MSAKSLNIAFSGSWFVYLEPVNKNHPAMPEIKQLMIKYICDNLNDFGIAKWVESESLSAIEIAINKKKSRSKYR